LAVAGDIERAASRERANRLRNVSSTGVNVKIQFGFNIRRTFRLDSAAGNAPRRGGKIRRGVRVGWQHYDNHRRVFRNCLAKNLQ
jgi:hypothetical protein